MDMANPHLDPEYRRRMAAAIEAGTTYPPLIPDQPEEPQPETPERGNADLFGMLDAGNQPTVTERTGFEDTDGMQTWLQIDRVTFRALRSDHDYNHEAIEATSVVDETQDPEAVLAALKGWVHDQFDRAYHARKVDRDVAALENRKVVLQADIDSLKERVDGIKSTLKKLGVDPTTIDDLFNLVPF